MSSRNRLRVQEYISRSGKYHLSVSGYDDVKSAYVEMRTRARMTARAMTGYPDVDISVSNETIIVTNGNARRVFSLVVKRGGDPVPFQYLLKD